MAFLSAKAFFENNTEPNKRLLIRMETEMPHDFVRLYKKNVAPMTPMSPGGGALRRSVITQVLGNTANISWRSPYAAAQNAGGHEVKKVVRGPNKRDGGYGIIPARKYVYTNGARGFAGRAFRKTKLDMQAELRQKGFTK